MGDKKRPKVSQQQAAEFMASLGGKSPGDAKAIKKAKQQASNSSAAARDEYDKTLYDHKTNGRPKPSASMKDRASRASAPSKRINRNG